MGLAFCQGVGSEVVDIRIHDGAGCIGGEAHDLDQVSGRGWIERVEDLSSRLIVEAAEDQCRARPVGRGEPAAAQAFIGSANDLGRELRLQHREQRDSGLFWLGLQEPEKLLFGQLLELSGGFIGVSFDKVGGQQ